MAPNDPSDRPLVCLILGSKSDLPIAEKATAQLEALRVPYELRVASAHRTPDHVAEVVGQSPARVFVCFAGLAAALPGSVAALTQRPVIGVPCSGKVPYDSLLAMVQMPPGVPVAAVGVDRGENGALLAAQILALGDNELARRLEAYRSNLAVKVVQDDEALRSRGSAD